MRLGQRNALPAIAAMATVLASSCAVHPSASNAITPAQTASRSRRTFCELPPGRDGELPIVTIARRALAEGDTASHLKADTIITVQDRVYEGSLVRMFPVSPMALGGGGLVWVDGDTNCAIVLKRYE